MEHLPENKGAIRKLMFFMNDLSENFDYPVKDMHACQILMVCMDDLSEF